MAASDHLGPQFFHGSPHAFQPGEVLTREGAWMAKHSENAAANARKLGWPTAESHLYYGDHSLMNDIGGMYKGGEGGHIYAVQPETSNGRAISKHSPDPHYKDYGGGAYRTTGRLRVMHEVDEHGNKVGG